MPIKPLSVLYLRELCTRPCAYVHGHVSDFDHKNALRQSATDSPEILQVAAIAGGDCSVYSTYINPCPTPVRSGTTTTPLAVPTSTLVNLACLKCGSNKKSGTRSCCARGGAWFQNCGNVGDTQFGHTWAEGIQACKRTFCAFHRSPCCIVGIC